MAGKDFYPVLSPSGSVWRRNHSFYGGESQFNPTDGINLRDELYDIFYGNGISTGKGHWAILRKFDTTQYSEFWNSTTREAVGGPAHPFEDILVRTRRRLVSRDTAGAVTDTDAPPGEFISPYLVYYLKYDLDPVPGVDQIFELDWESSEMPTNVSVDIIKERYNIVQTHIYRMDDYGRKEYWYCVVEKNLTRW